MTNNKNIFANNSPYKTNKLTKILLIIFLTLIPLIIIWVIFCQFNLLGLNWLVAQNASYFISNKQLEQINALIPSPDAKLQLDVNFYQWHILTDRTDLNKIQQYEATKQIIANFGEGYIFNNWMYLLIFGTLGLNLIVFIPLALFSKKIYLDVFPMMLSTWFGMTTLILTGLIPQKHAYTIPVQILAIVIIFIASVILFNFLFNKIIASSKWAETYYEKLLQEEKDSEEYYQEYLATKNKLNKNNNSTVVDIPDDTK